MRPSKNQFMPSWQNWAKSPAVAYGGYTQYVLLVELLHYEEALASADREIINN